MNKVRSCGRLDCPANKTSECDYFNTWIICKRHKEITTTNVTVEKEAKE